MTHWSLLGRRVLAIGPGLAPLARGPLFGAVFEMAQTDRLLELAPDSVDIVLIDTDAADGAVLLAAITALAAAPAPPPTLLLGSQLPAGLVRTVLRLKHSDMLEAPYSDEQLLAAVYGLLDTAKAEDTTPARRGSRCWSVLGAVGGAGGTTVAIEMAHALAARSRSDRSVCLVDLNLADGAAAGYLGVTPAMGLSDFGSSVERMDAALLAAFATPAFKGLDLLAGPRDPLAFEKVSREAVLRLLEIACDAYHVVVVDMPRHRQPWTLDVLRGSDEVVVVSELTVPALLAARALSDEVEAELSGGAKTRIVLNRLAHRMFGPAPSLVEAERALQRKAEGGVSSDWEAAAASVNLGGPISHHRPKSKIVRDISAIVDRLLVEAERDPKLAGRAA